MRRWHIGLAIIGLCAVALLWFPLLRIATIASLNYNEGWNAYRDHLAAFGHQLYAAPPRFWITDYPFLSFYIVGLFGRLIGATLLAGRIISLASLAATCALLAALVRHTTTHWRCGLYAGLCLFLWIAIFTSNRIGIDDPETLADAMALGGVYLLVRGIDSPRRGALWLIASAIALAAALFTKLDIIAFPLASLLYLGATRRWRALSIWCATGISTAALLLMLAERFGGPYFLTDLLWPRAYELVRLRSAILSYLTLFALPLLFGALVLFRLPLIRKRGLYLTLLLTSTLIAIGFSGGDGVAGNIFNPALIAMAAACGAALDAIDRTISRRSWSGLASALAFALPVGAALIQVPAQIRADIAFNQRLPRLAQQARRIATLLRPLHGLVICEDILICYQAGKPLSYDSWFVTDQIRLRQIDPQSILAALAAHHYAAIVIGTVRDPDYAHFHIRFSKIFTRTLRRHDRLIYGDLVYRVYVPKLTRPKLTRTGPPLPRIARKSKLPP